MQNFPDPELPVILQHAIAACCSIVEDYFAKQTNSFMLSTNIEEKILQPHIRDFINNVLLCLNSIKVEVENVHGQRGPSFNRKYNLIVVDSAEALRRLDPGHNTRDYDIQEIYLVYLMNASRFPNLELQLQDIFAYFWQNYIINVTIVIVNTRTGSVEALTYYPFYDNISCKMVHVEKINSFLGEWSKPLDDNIFPEKVENLHQCPLTVAVWETPPYFSYRLNANGFYDIGFFEADLLLALVQKMNFTMDLQEPPNNEQRGKVLDNGTFTGALKMLQEHIADFSLGSFRYTLERSQLMTAALPYYQTWQIYGFLRTAQPYSSLEILVFAFDGKTWFCLILSILMVMAISHILQFQYKNFPFLRIILGHPRPAGPVINVVRIFFGQGISILPRTNFTRFVLVLWDVFGLLMRTAYQSLLFQLLKGNQYHEPPQNLGDLITKNCKLVATEGTFDSVDTVPRIQAGLIDVVKIKNTSEQSTFHYMEENTKNGQCFAGISPMDFLTYHATQENKRGVFFVLPEKIFTQHITMYFSKHSFLINRINFLLMSLRSMGLIDFWAKHSLDQSYFDAPNDVHFEAVEFSKVVGFFGTYLALMLLASIVFCLEIILFNLKRICYVSRRTK
ncbi:glutamate receptor ionotropic, NMDA 2B-like [Musca autumnalis]|uniref:glutamate receptor ionotropic, NMDA 2B-like n=1 Tax=Musca autumnalis TaxID=221902 RepID=UPI003CE800AA